MREKRLLKCIQWDALAMVQRLSETTWRTFRYRLWILERLWELTCPISIPDCYWDVCCWWSDSWRSLRLLFSPAAFLSPCSWLPRPLCSRSWPALPYQRPVLLSPALVLRSALSGFGMPFRLACAPSASFGTLCGDMQSSVGHQRTASASPPSFSFTRWRHLRTGTLTICLLYTSPSPRDA